MPKKKSVKKSETSDEDTAKTDVHCSHVNKSVNISQVRKALKHPTVLGRCQFCYANNESARKKPEKRSDLCENFSSDSLNTVDGLPSDYEPSVFICLHCGHQGCDRYTPDKHALQHFETTAARSVAHNIVLDLMSYQVWCYPCDKFIPVEASKKLLECANFVYHNAGHKDSITSFVKRPEINKENGFSLESSSPESPRDSDPVVRDEMNRLRTTQITQTTSGSLLKVKGLYNLGNTCFFNAVVQNLIQTELLESVLRDSCKSGHSIDLSISLPESTMRSCPDDKTNGKEQEPKQDLHKEHDLHKVETLSLSLGECGMLTQSVVNLFEEMKASNKQSSISPSALFGQVCKKAPRFKGFQQHDSHELLRHLLDAIKGEEIKRAHTSILGAFRSSERPSLTDVPDDLRSKIKAFGNQAKHTFVDSIFGGHFISTVVCQACDTHHQIFEPFLDISLPVIEEKPFKSRAQHSGKSEEDKNGPENAEAHSGEIKKSKHMSKKERQMAKKNASKNRKGSGKTGRQSRTNTAEESDFVASATAAADVENDAEEETAKTNDAKCDGGGPSVEAERHSGEEREGEDDHENVDDKVECSAELETSINEYQQVETSTYGELRNSSLESESSDADVEDNEESDASRYRGMVNSIDTFPEGNNCRKAEHDGAVSSGLTDEHKELENSDDLTLDQIDKAANAIQSGGENIDRIASDIGAMQLRANFSPEEEKKVLSGQPSAAAAYGDSSSKEEMEIYSSARKAAMKTLVPREKPNGQECSVLSSLYQFTLSELLSGNNMYRCTVCNKADKDGKAVQGQKSMLTYASQQFLIYSPPAILTLHLKRFQQVGFNLHKITRHIEFSELLDLAPFCSALCQKIQAGQRRILYSLYGIVEHRGTLRSGHYTAYVKVRNSNPNTKRFLETLITGEVTVQHLVDAMQTALPNIRVMGESESVNTEDSNTKHVVPPLGKWYYISDSTVSEVKSISNILSCQAYILFYERIE